jgi:predicted HAD superfamily Cof-like phosphohydrolase
MSNEFVEGVLELNRGANRPEEFSPRFVAFHTGMQLEEMAEKLEAILKGCKTQNDTIHAHMVERLRSEMDHMGKQFKQGTYDQIVSNGDRHGMLDADVDIQVVTIGGMMTAGNDIEGALGEVNRANLDKKFPDGTYHLDQNGKIQKPPGWKAPDLSSYVVKK